MSNKQCGNCRYWDKNAIRNGDNRASDCIYPIPSCIPNIEIIKEWMLETEGKNCIAYEEIKTIPNHTIEIEGLPPGWEAVAYRVPKQGDYILNDREKIQYVDADYQLIKCLIVQKTKPRRIVLEETEEDNEEYHYLDDSSYYAGRQYIKNLANQGGLMIEFVQPVSNYVLIEYANHCIGSIKNKKKSGY